MDDEVEADGLLPVDVRVSDGELLAVPPPHLHQVTLAGAQLPEHQSQISIKEVTANDKTDTNYMSHY